MHTGRSTKFSAKVFRPVCSHSPQRWSQCTVFPTAGGARPSGTTIVFNLRQVAFPSLSSASGAVIDRRNGYY
jgi:hypothetical protein